MAVLVSVSTLNVLVNLFVLLIVAVGNEIGQYAMYKATQLHLKRHRRAPLLTEPDDIFSRLSNRCDGARRSSSIVTLAFVLVSASLLFGEISSEFGVQSSNRCSPRRINTRGLCASAPAADASESKKITTAFHARLAKWDDTELTNNPVFQGFRKNFDGTESFKQRPSATNVPVVVANCSRSAVVEVASYDGSITVDWADNVWKVFVSEMTISNGSKPIRGLGDLTHNGIRMSAFLISGLTEDGVEAKVNIVEYHDSNDLAGILNSYFASFQGRPRAMIVRNASPMITYNLTCLAFSPSRDKFVDAMQVYRSVQLEDATYGVQNVTVGNKRLEIIPPMSASDAMRATIALATLSPDLCNGETFVYTECGVYDWKFMIPLLVLFLFVSAFAVIKAVLVIKEKANIVIPYTSSSWSALALRNTIETDTDDNTPGDGKAFESQERGRPNAYRGFYELRERADGGEEVLFMTEGGKAQNGDEDSA